MKRLIIFLLLLIPLLAMAEPLAKVTFKVVDEKGMPIEGANVVIGYTVNEIGRSSPVSNAVKGLSDSDGEFSAIGQTWNRISGSVRKEGYYLGGPEYYNYNDAYGIWPLQVWKPWNPTLEVVLKEIKNPIPMYAYNVGYIVLPGVGRYYGYDLIARDWVVPYGQGVNRDFLFKLDKRMYKSGVDYDMTLTLKFSNPADGIQSWYTPKGSHSELRMPYQAPETGYQPELVQEISRTPEQINYYYRDDQNYFFRVRTEQDAEGNIISALYGKIHGYFDLTGFAGKTGQVIFTYYLNPNSLDRNMEMDVKKNLFKHLPFKHAVKKP